jgi:hypothetical protein
LAPDLTTSEQTTTVELSAAGSYVFLGTATDDSTGLSVPSSVTVNVAQTATSIQVSPQPIQVAAGSTAYCSATVLDQFGNSIAPQPTAFSWSVADPTVGYIGGYGRTTFFAYGPNFSNTTISATADGVSGSAPVFVTSNPVELLALPFSTVVTNQYPGVVFSAPAGDAVYSDSDLNDPAVPGIFLVEGNTPGGLTINFSSPVSGLRFETSLSYDEPIIAGVVGTISVDTYGTYAGTVNIVYQDEEEFFDLTGFNGITSIQVNLNPGAFFPYVSTYWDIQYQVVPPIAVALGDGSANQILQASSDGTQNLVPLHVSVPPGLPTGTQVILTAGAPNEVDVWDSSDPQTGDAPLLGGTGDTSTTTWTVGTDSIPSTLYLGATAGSAAVGDIVFTLAATLPATYSGTTVPSSTTQPASAISVQIQTENAPNGGNTGDDWTGKTENWLAGQMVDLKAIVSGPPALTANLTYNWSVAGDTLYSYPLTTGATQVTPTGLAADNGGHTGTSDLEVRFFWVSTSVNPEPDKIQLTVGASNGKNYSVSTTFNLSEPNVSQLNPITGSVQLFPAPQAIPNYGINQGDYILEAGSGSPQAFSLATSVTLPNGFNNTSGGQWTFLQTIETNTRVSQNNSYYTWSYNNRWYLDTGFPPSTIVDANGNPTTYASLTSAVYTFSDTPNVDLSANDFPLPNGKSVIGSMDQQSTFTTYVMFQPPGNNSQWVAVKSVGWHWGASVNKPGTRDQNGNLKWQYVGNPQNPSVQLITSPTYEPTFTDKWNNGNWQLA